MVGAYDDGGGINVPSTSVPKSNPIDKLRSVQAEFDKAFADPKTSMSKLNNITNKLNSALSAVINYQPTSVSSPTSSTNTITNTNNDNIYENTSSNLKATPTTSSITIVPPTTPIPVKTATPDIILFDDTTLPIEVMTDLIFENIGGQELLNIARTDTINGQKIIYQPIKNLTTIQQKYNPNNILNIDKTSDKHFAGYAIKLEEKIPSIGNGTNGENIYIDAETGDLVIEVINMSRGEQVELEISINGTIYEAEI
jgi:hypothetical protein